MCRNRHLKKNIIGLRGNEGENIFTPFAQAELLKNFYSSIYREGDARPTPILPVPTVVIQVPKFSIRVVHRELSSLDISKGAGPDGIHPQMVGWLCRYFFLMCSCPVQCILHRPYLGQHSCLVLHKLCLQLIILYIAGVCELTRKSPLNFDRNVNFPKVACEIRGIASGYSLVFAQAFLHID